MYLQFQLLGSAEGERSGVQVTFGYIRRPARATGEPVSTAPWKEKPYESKVTCSMGAPRLLKSELYCECWHLSFMTYCNREGMTVSWGIEKENVQSGPDFPGMKFNPPFPFLYGAYLLCHGVKFLIETDSSARLMIWWCYHCEAMLVWVTSASHVGPSQCGMMILCFLRS